MWQEPEPPSPKPIVTGFPIESLPPQKSLKDKKKTSLSNEFDSPSASSANSPAATSYTTFKSEENNSSARELACSRESIVNSDSRSISPDVESRFKIRLKTSMLDTVQQESQIRRSTRVAGQDLNYYAKAREALGISKRKRSSTPPATLLKPKDRNIKPETPVKSTILSPSTPEKSPKKHKRIKITVYVLLYVCELFEVRREN